MPTLTIIRGLPGSGKSTIAKKISEQTGAQWFEADKFFTNETTGEYNFDASLLSDAHQWCQLSSYKQLRDGNDVVVSNTFTRSWEYSKYIDFRLSLPDVTVKIIEVLTQYESIHSVPEKTLQEMKQRWETTPEDLDIEVTRIV
jgi:adenylate kinase family enzyme